MKAKESKTAKNMDSNHLTDWIERNCKACKFFGKGITLGEESTGCIVPNEILKLVVDGTELSKAARIIVTGLYWSPGWDMRDYFLGRCYARQVQRGRKR